MKEALNRLNQIKKMGGKNNVSKSTTYRVCQQCKKPIFMSTSGYKASWLSERRFSRHMKDYCDKRPNKPNCDRCGDVGYIGISPFPMTAKCPVCNGGREQHGWVLHQ